MSDPVVSATKSRPENLLFHSRIEIIRIMQLLAWKQSHISAELKDGYSFDSHLLYVDRKGDRFFVALLRS